VEDTGAFQVSKSGVPSEPDQWRGEDSENFPGFVGTCSPTVDDDARDDDPL
jgi:hypothetical protein